MKELCIDARMLMGSGIGTYLKNLILQLKDSDFRLRLIVHPDAPKRLNWLTDFDLILCDAPIYSIAEQVKLPRLIPACDIFWAPHFNIPLFPIRAKKRVVTIHDVYHLAFFSRLRIHEKCYAKMLFSRVEKFAGCIVTVSQFSKSEIQKHTKIQPGQIQAIHNGVNRVYFSLQKDARQINLLKQKYSLPEKFILYVGNFKSHKNIAGLMKAFQRLRERGFAEYSLVLVGKRASEDLAALTDKQILFLEHVSDDELTALYQSAALYVQPSFYEGFGLPPIGAMSCGCPVLASRAASLPEVCNDAAEYFDPSDVEDMASSMEKVLVNPQLLENLKKRGFVRASQFSWEKSAEAHLQVFEEVLR